MDSKCSEHFFENMSFAETMQSFSCKKDDTNYVSNKVHCIWICLAIGSPCDLTIWCSFSTIAPITL